MEGEKHEMGESSMQTGNETMEMASSTKDLVGESSRREVQITMPESHKSQDAELERCMIFSCITCFCCNVLFGGIAWLVARSGRNASPEKSRRLARITCGLNVTGMLVTWIILAIILALHFTHHLGNYLPYYST